MVAALDRSSSESDRLAELKKAALSGRRRPVAPSPSRSTSAAGFDLLRTAIEDATPLDDRPLSVEEQLEADPLLAGMQQAPRAGRRAAAANPGLSMLEMVIASGEPLDDAAIEQARAAQAPPRRRAPAKKSARAPAAPEEDVGLSLLQMALASGEPLDDEVVVKARRKTAPTKKASAKAAPKKRLPVEEEELGGLSMLERAISSGEPMPDDFVQQTRARGAAAAGAARGAAAAGRGARGVAAAQPAPVPAAPMQDPDSVQAQLDSFCEVGSADRVIPRMKRPEELRELLRICRTAFKGAHGFEEAEVHQEEIDIQVVRLTGRGWLEWLRINDLVDVGKDPGRHPAQVRQEFLAFWAKQGCAIPTQAAARAAVKEYEDSRTERDVRRACGYVEKLAMDFATIFGEKELEKVVQDLAYKTNFDVASAANEELARRALGSIAIVQAYIDKGVATEKLFGRDNLLSADWDRSMSYQEFEQKRVLLLRQLKAALQEQSHAPVVKTVDVVTGQAVELEVRQRSPIGFVVKVDDKYEGLVYHSDIFEQPPKMGDRLEGWVVKVRDDGKVDVSLRPPGAKAKISDGVEKVLEALQKSNGHLDLGDKSAPKEIYARLGLSKKVFKEALGSMYKRHMILPDDFTVVLQPPSQWVTGLAKERSGAGPAPKARKARGKAAAKPAAGAETVKRRKGLESASKGAGDSRRQTEQMLVEDAMEHKREAQKRLRDQRAKDKHSKLLKERVDEERKRMDPALMEQRKQLLKSRDSSSGGGLKATLARLKASKLQQRKPPGSRTKSAAEGE